jgi:hypothetical protein
MPHSDIVGAFGDGADAADDVAAVDCGVVILADGAEQHESI